MARPQMHLLTLAVLLLVVTGLYLATWPANFTEGEDAVYYTWRVGTGQAQFHPNHLLFEPVNRLLVLLTGWPALTAMQGLSLAAALATLALTWRLLGEAGARDWRQWAAPMVLAGCFGFWLYGMYPDTYALPLPFVLGALIALARYGKSGSTGALAAMALLGAAATLLHQQHVFLLPVLALGVVRCHRETGRPGLARALGLLVLIFALPIGLGYFGTGFLILGHHNPLETIAWARGYASDGMWVPFSLLSPVKALIGLGTAIWAPQFLFAIPGASGAIARAFPGKALDEEFYFAAHGLAVSPWLVAAAVLAGIACALVLAWSALHGSGRARLTGPPRDWLAYILLYGLVVTIWEPDNKEFWIAVLPVLLALIFARLAPARWPVRIAAFLLAGTLFLGNGLGAMAGFARGESDYWRALNRDLIEGSAQGDVIVDACPYICTGYLLLFAPAVVLPPDQLDRAGEFGAGRVLVTERALAALGWPELPRTEISAHMGLSVYALTP